MCASPGKNIKRVLYYYEVNRNPLVAGYTSCFKRVTCFIARRYASLRSQLCAFLGAILECPPTVSIHMPPSSSCERRDVKGTCFSIHASIYLWENVSNMAQTAKLTYGRIQAGRRVIERSRSSDFQVSHLVDPFLPLFSVAKDHMFTHTPQLCFPFYVRAFSHRTSRPSGFLQTNPGLATA